MSKQESKTPTPRRKGINRVIHDLVKSLQEKVKTLTTENEQLKEWLKLNQAEKIEPIGRIVCSINGTAAEIEYTNKDGQVVGYWAYGSFDPKYPCQG